jgi:hypothetical protein
LDSFDEVLFVQPALELSLIRRNERDHRFPGITHGLGFYGRLVGHGSFDESMRCQPDLRQPSIHRRSHVAFIRRAYGVLADDIPRVLPTEDPDLPQFADERLKAAAPWWILCLLASPLIPHGRNGVVDRHRVAGHIEARPRIVSVIGLAEHVIGSPSGELNRLEVCGAKRRRGRIKRGLPVLGMRGHDAHGGHH